MKRKGIVFFVAALLIMAVLGMGMVSADGGFELEESYPKDGSKNAAVENLGVKLTFTTPVNSEENRATNDKCFRLIGPDGKDLPIKVYYNPKEEKQILVLYDSVSGGQLTAKNSETYQAIISGELLDNNGAKLGDDITITFDSINQSRNTKIYFVVMLLMMAAMAFMTQKQARKKLAEAEEGKPAEEVFNPYKEAKRTGRPVAEIIAEHEKEMAKKEAKMAKKDPKPYDDDFEDWDEEDIDNGNYKVKAPRRISEGGSSYITGRKALAEAKKAEEERLARRRAKNKKK